MKTHKTVALLPMKQNSERIKSKNFKEFAGKPLFLWMLETLLNVPSIEKIVINTDATETLKNNKIPPTINLNNPDSDCDLNYTPNVLLEKELHTAMSNSFGFGGHNAVLVFSK